MAKESSNITTDTDKIVGTTVDIRVSIGDNISEITVGGERYRLHAFLTSRDFTISEEYPVDVLVVAGGGSGGVGGDGSWEPGGSGASGVVYIPSYLVSGTIPVIISDGKAAVAGSYNARPGNKGEGSVFDNITAIGGGRGGAGSHDGGSGGSGGGGPHIRRVEVRHKTKVIEEETGVSATEAPPRAPTTPVMGAVPKNQERRMVLHQVVMDSITATSSVKHMGKGDTLAGRSYLRSRRRQFSQWRRWVGHRA